MRVATKVVFWLTCLSVVAIAVAPGGSLPSHVFEWWDKAQHAAAFATLMLLRPLGCGGHEGAAYE